MAANTNETIDLFCPDEHKNSWDDEGICRLQALIRAFLIRKKFLQLRSLYEEIVRKVEGDVCSSEPSVIEWKTGLPCRPRILPKPHKSSTTVKGKRPAGPTPCTKSPPADPKPVQDDTQEMKSQEANLGSETDNVPLGFRGQDSIAVDGSLCRGDNRSSQVTSENGINIITGLSISQDGEKSPTQTQHPALSANQMDIFCSEAEEGTPRKHEDADHQDQNRSTPSEESDSSSSPRESSKQPDSAAETSSKNSEQVSPRSSMEYTSDFESYESTSSQVSDVHVGSGSVKPNSSDVVTSQEQIALSDGKVADGIEKREFAERTDNGEVVKMNSNHSGSDGNGTRLHSHGLGSLSESGKVDAALSEPGPLNSESSRIPTRCNGEGACSGSEARTISSSGGAESELQDETDKAAVDANRTSAESNHESPQLPSQSLKKSSEWTNASGAADRESVDADSGGMVAKEDAHGEEIIGSPNRNSETETVSNPSKDAYRTEDQRDGTALDIDAGKIEEEDTGLRASLSEDAAAGKSSPVIPERRMKEQDLSIGADMTSIWSNENSFADLSAADCPTDLGELQKMRSSIALELLWVQQAINSRKNYLRLRSNIEPTGPPSPSS